MDGEVVEPQAEVMDQVIDQMDNNNDYSENDDYSSSQEQKMVPLSALQKQRQKTREKELEAQWERQEREKLMANRSSNPISEEEDESRYESATKQDLRTSQEEAIRAIEERLWIKQNPEKYELINTRLEQFLKKRPNLVSAINQASNRYEEAYELMDALTPKQQQQLKVAQPKREAPNAPGGIPKAAVLDHAVDLMSMSDSEFTAWKQSKKTRR